MKVLNNKELEFKFDASDIKLTDFIEFANEVQKPTESLYICGYDHFYSNAKDPNMFIRHRVGDNFNQLTVKRKLADRNNFIRDEINISLGKDVSEANAAALAKSMGYEFNVSIFKTVFVYNYPTHVLSYYVVYDLNLKEMSRFFEIEMSETYDWKNEDAAWEELRSLEYDAGLSLGIKPQGRIKRSLYEQFKR